MPRLLTEISKPLHWKGNIFPFLGFAILSICSAGLCNLCICIDPIDIDFQSIERREQAAVFQVLGRCQQHLTAMRKFPSLKIPTVKKTRVELESVHMRH